jgi:hypothetical protein
MYNSGYVERKEIEILAWADFLLRLGLDKPKVTARRDGDSDLARPSSFVWNSIPLIFRLPKADPVTGLMQIGGARADWLVAVPSILTSHHRAIAPWYFLFLFCVAVRAVKPPQ